MTKAIRPASYWTPEENNRVHCWLCPHLCLIAPGQTGRCRVRQNRDGSLYTLVYGLLSASALDPIEKKPLRRFHPGSKILSVGSVGCNFNCSFCQNHRIATAGPGDIPMAITTPQELTTQARYSRGQGNIGVAYTYNEPTVWFEFIRDTARVVRDANMVNVMVTNGYIEPEPLTDLLELIDAFNIDLKGFRDDFYRRVGGTLQPVLETIRRTRESGAHVEVTTLIIPGQNDDPEEMDAQCAWLASISEDIPLHLSRFFPMHRMTDRPPTPPDTIWALKDIARRHLRYVYTGNMP